MEIAGTDAQLFFQLTTAWLCKGNGQDLSKEGCSGVMEAAVDESMLVLS